MDRKVFMNGVRTFCDGANIELSMVRPSIFQLKLRDVSTSRRYFIQTDAGEDEVSEVNFSCWCGVVVAPNALVSLLRKNRGGVMNSSFYFAVLDVAGDLVVVLETKIHLSEEMGVDDVEERLSDLWMNPLFMMTWEFPEGVKNFLW